MEDLMQIWRIWTSFWRDGELLKALMQERALIQFQIFERLPRQQCGGRSNWNLEDHLRVHSAGKRDTTQKAMQVRLPCLPVKGTGTNPRTLWWLLAQTLSHSTIIMSFFPPIISILLCETTISLGSRHFFYFYPQA